MAQPEMPGGRAIADFPPELALRAIQPEMAALEGEPLVPINIDVMTAVTDVLGKLPKLRALRAEIAEQLPKFNLERFDRLEQYALALNHANVLHRGSLEHRSSITELGAEVTQFRDRLLNDAESLAQYGFIDGERLKECKKTPGHRPLANDVFLLVSVFKENWPKIQGRTPVTVEAVEEAQSTALELLGAIAERDEGPKSPAEAQLVRQRAYTLFFRAYEDARKAVAYLRRDEDDDVVDGIAPTLFAKRARGSSATAESPPDSPEPTAEAKPKVSAPAGDVATPVINNPHNLPIGSPFN